MIRLLTRHSMPVMARHTYHIRRCFSNHLPGQDSNGLSAKGLSELVSNPRMAESLEKLGQEQPSFDKIDIFNIESLSTLPPWFQFLEPVVANGKVDHISSRNSWLNYF